MSRKLPIFYSTFLLTGVNLILRLVSTSFQVYLSGRIGAAGIGLVQLVLSVGMLAMTAGIAGIRTATMYLTAEELGRKKPGNINWVLSACMVYSILCSSAVSLLLWYFAPQIAGSWIGDIRTVSSIRLFSFFLPVSCLCGVLSGYFTAANRIGTLAAVEVAEQLCSMAATVLLLSRWAGHDTVRSCQAVIMGSGFSGCLTLSILVILRIRENSPSGEKIPLRSRLLQAAVPLALADDLKSGLSTAENLMVPKRLSLYSGVTDSMAVFGIICGMVFPVLMFPAAILFGLAELLIPELARCNAAGSENRIRYLAMRSLRFALIYGCLCCGLLYLGADRLCMRLFRNPDAGFHLRHFALLAPMLYCDSITDAMTKGMGQQKACVRYNILTSALDVTFLFLLLPRYGMGGYFFSFTVTHLLNFLLSFRKLRKIIGKVLPWKTVLLSLLATFCSLKAASCLSGPFWGGISFLLMLGSLLVLMKVVSREDLLWVKGLVRTR